MKALTEDTQRYKIDKEDRKRLNNKKKRKSNKRSENKTTKHTLKRLALSSDMPHA